MYLYFDKSGLLKEVINDEALRVGSDGANTVFAYFEGDRIINGVYFNILRNGDTSPIRHAYTSLVSKQIPYDANRTLNYFKYFVNYNFYTYTFDSTDLAINGLLKLTIQAYDNSDIVFALGLVPLIIEASAVATTTQITTSEYEDLLKSIANFPTWSALESYIGLSRSDLQGLTLANVKAYIDSYHIASVDNTMLTGVLTTKITLNNGNSTASSIDLGNTFNTKQVQLAIDGAQDANINAAQSTANAAQSTANTAVANAQTAQNTADEALALANAKNKSYSFATFNDMKSALASAVSTIYHVGDNLYIEATDSPDYWVSKVNAVSSGDYGYYEIKELEVDTSTFAKQSSLNTTNQNVATNTSDIASIQTNYATTAALATTNQNVSNNASAISSIQANYATNLALQAVEDEIPTNVGELTNNVGYITATNYAGESVGGVILASSLSGSETNLVEVKINATTHKLYAPSIPTLDIEIVASLPTTGSTGVIYLVPATTTTTTNLYKECVWVNSKWEELGNLDIQLSNYATITWVQSQLNTKQNVINITDNTLDTTYTFSNIVILTQDSYDNLSTKNNSTKYIIKDSIVSYLGTIQESGVPILNSPIYYTSKASLLADYPTTTSEINETIGLNYNVGTTTNTDAPFINYTNLTYIKGIVLGDNFTSGYFMFYGAKIKNIILGINKIQTLTRAFSDCSYLETANIYSNNVTSFGACCSNCIKLKSFIMSDCSKIGTISDYTFSNCVEIIELRLPNIKNSFNISWSTKMTEQALVNLLNDLATVATTQTLTMGATNLAKLTDTDKTIATNKGWTLA